MEYLSQICSIRREGNFGLKHQFFSNAFCILTRPNVCDCPACWNLMIDRSKPKLYPASPGDGPTSWSFHCRRRDTMWQRNSAHILTPTPNPSTLSIPQGPYSRKQRLLGITIELIQAVSISKGGTVLFVLGFKFMCLFSGWVFAFMDERTKGPRSLKVLSNRLSQKTYFSLSSEMWICHGHRLHSLPGALERGDIEESVNEHVCGFVVCPYQGL